MTFWSMNATLTALCDCKIDNDFVQRSRLVTNELYFKAIPVIYQKLYGLDMQNEKSILSNIQVCQDHTVFT